MVKKWGFSPAAAGVNLAKVRGWKTDHSEVLNNCPIEKKHQPEVNKILVLVLQRGAKQARGEHFFIIFLKGQSRVKTIFQQSRQSSRLKACLWDRFRHLALTARVTINPSMIEKALPKPTWPWVKIRIVPPVNILNPTTKIGSLKWVLNSPSPKWDPKTVLTSHMKHQACIRTDGKGMVAYPSLTCHLIRFER